LHSCWSIIFVCLNSNLNLNSLVWTLFQKNIKTLFLPLSSFPFVSAQQAKSAESPWTSQLSSLGAPQLRNPIVRAHQPEVRWTSLIFPVFPRVDPQPRLRSTASGPAAAHRINPMQPPVPSAADGWDPPVIPELPPEWDWSSNPTPAAPHLAPTPLPDLARMPRLPPLAFISLLLRPWPRFPNSSSMLPSCHRLQRLAATPPPSISSSTAIQLTRSVLGGR
jgi:hypothetical protein